MILWCYLFVGVFKLCGVMCDWFGGFIVLVFGLEAFAWFGCCWLDCNVLFYWRCLGGDLVVLFVGCCGLLG